MPNDCICAHCTDPDREYRVAHRGATMTDHTPAAALAKAAMTYRIAGEELAAARTELAQAVRDAIADGMSQSEAARIVGVDRLTIRKWMN